MTKFMAEHKVSHHAVAVTLCRLGQIGSGKQQVKYHFEPPIFNKLAVIRDHN